MRRAIARAFDAVTGAGCLARPLHIVQPRAPGASPSDPVDVPRRFLLFARVWHSVYAQVALTLLYRLLRPFLTTEPVSFVLFAMPRSGSTALVHALNGHPRVACAGEILNPHYRVYGDVSPPSHAWRRALHIDAILVWLAAWLRLRACYSDDDEARDPQAESRRWSWQSAAVSATGFKVLDEQLHQGYGSSLCALRDACRLLSGASRKPRVVLLARRDLGKAFASRCRAHASGVWYDESGERAQATAKADAGVAEGVAATSEDMLEETLEEALDYAEWTRAYWHAVETEMLSQQLPVLRLYHEQLEADPEGALRRLASYLDLPSPAPAVLTRQLDRMARSRPASWPVSAAPTRWAAVATPQQRARLRFCYLEQDNVAWWRTLPRGANPSSSHF